MLRCCLITCSERFSISFLKTEGDPTILDTKFAVVHGECGERGVDARTGPGEPGQVRPILNKLSVTQVRLSGRGTGWLKSTRAPGSR